MISIAGTARIFFYQGVVDMRKSFEGLSQVVEEAFDEELLSGSYFAFVNRRRDRIKVLYWDVDGLAIWYKRLEKGTFSESQIDKHPMDRKGFLMLLEGITPKKISRRYKIS